MIGEPILSTAELASIRREFRGASLLPARAYQAEEILAWEREHIIQRDWVLAAAGAPRPRATGG